MEKIKLTIPTGVHHGAQIITGFLMLKEQGWDVEIIDRSRDRNTPFYGLPALLAEYREKAVLRCVGRLSGPGEYGVGTSVL